MTNYRQAKEQLKTVSKEVKRQYPNDKPLIRQAINDTVHFLSVDYDLTEYQRDKLANYACKLHP